MAPVEYAWTSFDRNAVIVEASTAGKAGERFHPTQKPVALYTRLLQLFANPGDRILDTHVGSASSLIACAELGYEYTGFEIDEEYYTRAKARLDAETAQYSLFGFNPYQE